MTQRMVKIDTQDGICPAALSIPDSGGPWPAVVMFADARGLRDAMREMGERLSALGYIVLVPDYYYRVGPYDPAELRKSTEMVMSMMRDYTAAMAVRDAASLCDYLESLPEKKPGAIATTGYCFGGRLSLIAAGGLGSRLAAAASFHGGNLAKDGDPDSPHHRAGDIRGAIYVAGAIEDQSFPDEQRDLLETVLSEAGVTHTIETYPAHHGFAVSDNDRFDQAAADRHWQAIESFLGSTL